MDINSVKHSDLLDKAELRHPAGAKALLNWSGWPVSWSLGTNPKLLRRPLLFASSSLSGKSQPSTSESIRVLERCLGRPCMNYLLSLCWVNAGVYVVYLMLGMSEAPLKMLSQNARVNGGGLQGKKKNPVSPTLARSPTVFLEGVHFVISDSPLLPAPSTALPPPSPIKREILHFLAGV